MTTKRNTKRVRLEDLFVWKRPVVIKDREGNEVTTVYQRVLNDIDQEKARLAAIRKSHDMRRALRNKDSDEYASVEEHLETQGREQLINIILIQKFPDMYNRALVEAKTKMPVPPKDADGLEAVENYEAGVDTFDERLNAEVMDLVKKISDLETERLNGLSESELIDVARESLIEQICQNTATEYFNLWCTYLSTYEDEECTERYFNSFDDFNGLVTFLKEQLVQAYKKLTLGPEELKN